MSGLSGIRRASHIGLCVTDADRSMEFYCDLLGFTKSDELEVEGPLPSQLLGLEGVDLRAIYLERDGMVVELLHFRAPASESDTGPRPFNVAGFTHLSMQAEDPGMTLEELRQAGVPIVEESVLRIGEAVVAFFCLDPDGQRVEITGAR